MNKITSIFYKEIVPEAATGYIVCLFIYNMPFNTNIEGEMIKSKKKKHLFIPTLMKKNKIGFDSLLTEYIKKITKTVAKTMENIQLEHEKIQSNLTEKLTRTFLRLCHHHSGINVTSYPMELDSSLHLTIDENNQCNNPILAETYNLFKGKQR